MLTSDVQALTVGEGQPSLLLSAKGRIQGQLSVLREGDEAFTLVVPASRADHVVADLSEHLVSEEAELIGPEPVSGILIVATPERPRGIGDLVVPSDIPDGWLVVGNDVDVLLAAIEMPTAPPETLDLIRVISGVPRIGVDFAVDHALVQETGLEGLVSFTKGCYLGQETVARLEHRGHANRQLRALKLSDPVTAGAVVTSEGEPVGELTTVATSERLGVIGLALIRHEVEVGATVQIGGSAAEVTTLPLVTELP